MIKKTSFFLITIILLFATSLSAYAQNDTAIESFFFKIGGFSEGKVVINIDGNTKKLTWVWAQSFPENLTQTKLETFIKEEKNYIQVKKSTLTDKQLKALERELSNCKVKKWNNKYINRDIMDGTEWELRITFKDKTQLKSVGINKFPKQWEQFKKAVTEHTEQPLRKL